MALFTRNFFTYYDEGLPPRCLLQVQHHPRSTPACTVVHSCGLFLFRSQFCWTALFSHLFGRCEGSFLFRPHIYKTVIQPILTYGCSTLNFKHTDINELEKAQASLIKTALGLPKYSRNTPILRALHIKKISEILEEHHLALTRAALHNTAKSIPFYFHIMNKCQYYHMNKHSNLLQRAKLICNSNGKMLHKYLFNESYTRKCKLRLTATSLMVLLIQYILFFALMMFTIHNI